jgi:hypothetical protein
MLPPADLHTRCLRCGHDLGRDTRICPACGADRDLELAIYAELQPTISVLRKWLLALGALRLIFSGLLYEQLHDRVLDIWPIVAPGLVVGVVLLALATVAHRVPFAAAVIATSLFAAEWILAIIVDPVGALFPGFGLAFRLILGIVLVGAVRSGWRARVLRSRRPAPAV